MKPRAASKPKPAPKAVAKPVARKKGDLLDVKAIQRAELLGIQARTVVEGYMSGAHKSPFRGFAIEFAQHREYVPGDDTRHLDWKVLGRSDRYYIKQYEQETNFVSHILLDGSESMLYGSPKLPTKFEYARVMAACLAYLILLQRDAAAVTVFDSEIRDYLPRTDSMSKIHNIMATLSTFDPTQQTNVAAALHAMASQTKRKGIFMIISDLFDDEAKIMEGVQRLRFDGHEVILFHVLDPTELEFDFKGTVEFQGLEGQPKLTLQPASLRKSYLREFNAFLNRVKVGCERNRCPYIQIRTDQPWHEVLSAFLASRQHTAYH